MLRTRLTEAYGLEVPFIGAGMGFLATPPLVAAVCNAGGMGTLAVRAGPAASPGNGAAPADQAKCRSTAAMLSKSWCRQSTRPS